MDVKMEAKRQVLPKDLLVGERVFLGSGPYSTATVESVGPKAVTLVRPYIHTSDFTVSGGFIAYMGLEKVTIPLDESRPLSVYVERYPGPREASSQEQANELASRIEFATGRLQRVVTSADPRFFVQER